MALTLRNVDGHAVDPRRGRARVIATSTDDAGAITSRIALVPPLTRLTTVVFSRPSDLSPISHR